MAKSRALYVCQNCAASYPNWTGKCDNCGEWNSLVQQIVDSGKSAVARGASSGKVLSPQSMQDISIEESNKRMLTGFDDLDMVLGGGILPGGTCAPEVSDPRASGIECDLLGFAHRSIGP